jgi:DEAD/DEAH box helicase domain-containing protein
MILSSGIEGSNCREGNVVASKISAKVVLKGVLGLPIDVDSIPFNDGPRDPLETVVEASDIIQQSRNLRVEPATS